jgi:hypothetical protein
MNTIATMFLHFMIKSEGKFGYLSNSLNVLSNLNQKLPAIIPLTSILAPFIQSNF